MTSIKVNTLADDLPYGARIIGVNWKSLKDEGVREKIKDVFEDRGLIVFKRMESSGQIHLALSEVVGPLQDHPLKERAPMEQPAKPDVTNFNYKGDVVDADGRRLTGWIPWHYDACYTAKLNRGGVLRAIELPPEGGMTGFADGIQLFKAVSPKLRERFEGLSIIYHVNLVYMNQRFGMPKNHRWISLSENASKLIARRDDVRRSVHPAIWRRKSGEHVLHVSPWQAAGIQGRENHEGDALLESLCQEIYARMKPYWHKWELMDMVLWDNWRFIHAASGNDPKYARHLQRTTIEGDYGLGSFELGATGNEPPEMTV